MKEQSHLEAMREALRGDRERAEQARQRSVENVRALVEPAAEEKPPPEPEPEPEPEPQRPRGLRRFLGLGP